MALKRPFRARWDNTNGKGQMHMSMTGKVTACGLQIPAHAEVKRSRAKITCGSCLRVKQSEQGKLTWKQRGRRS